MASSNHTTAQSNAATNRKEEGARFVTVRVPRSRGLIKIGQYASSPSLFFSVMLRSHWCLSIFVPSRRRRSFWTSPRWMRAARSIPLARPSKIASRLNSTVTEWPITWQSKRVVVKQKSGPFHDPAVAFTETRRFNDTKPWSSDRSANVHHNLEMTFH